MRDAWGLRLLILALTLTLSTSLTVPSTQLKARDWAPKRAALLQSQSEPASPATLLRSHAEPASPAISPATEERAASRKAAAAAAAKGQREPFPQTMINFGDAQYISYLRIGRQILAGMLDTGSFDLVVFGADCRTCGVAAHYNPSLSATFRSGRLVSQQAYGNGVCFSKHSADIMQIGPFNELRQTFWTVQQASMPTLSSAAFEAIIGLGPPEAPAADSWKAVTATISNVTSYYDVAEHPPEWTLRMVDKRLEIADEVSAKSPLLSSFDVMTFSVCLGAAARSNGIFVWNDVDALTQPAVFARVPVSGNHSWSVRLGSPTVLPSNGPREQLAAAGSALLDSGMSLLAAPKIVVDRLRAAAERLHANCSNIAELPELAFELGSRTFSLPPEAYVAEVEGALPDTLAAVLGLQPTPAPRCQLLVVESVAWSVDGPLWILGMPFFRKYYTTFHVGASREERALYIAEAGEDCSPAMPGAETPDSLRDRPSLLRRVELPKVHLPQTARIAVREQFARL